VSDELHDVIAARLGRHGQRYTSGRRRLVEVLGGSGRPLTAAEVFEEATLAQSSAYRNLSVLEACGAVHRVSGADEFARFELAEDLSSHHHHLMCTECGAVADVTLPDGVEQALEVAERQVAAATGFVAARHRIDLIGRCAACAAAS
jgi:Fur family ferric uptake transcriptional regulator